MVLVEELPYVHGSHQREAIISQIGAIVASTRRNPLIFICSADPSVPRSLTALTLELQNLHGLCVIKFNPISPTQMEKALQRIIKAAGCKFLLRDAKDITNVANGDIRSASNLLQTWQSEKSLASGLVEHCGTSMALPIFHALGKLLYGKLTSDEFNERLTAEQLVQQAYIEPATFNAFVHQNFVHHFSDVADAADAADWLSHSDCFDAKSIFGLSGYSIAMLRGNQLSNRHRSTSHFRPLHKPALFGVMQQRAELLDRLCAEQHAAQGGLGRLKHWCWSRMFDRSEYALSLFSRSSCRNITICLYAPTTKPVYTALLLNIQADHSEARQLFGAWIW
jgi:hypothetical protein